MPKAKTHSGAAKRFKVTGTGKIKYKSANKRHNFGNKTPKMLRRYNKDKLLYEGDVPRVQAMLNLETSRRKKRYNPEEKTDEQ